MMHANVANDWWQSPTQTPNDQARQQASERQNQLTKPPGSLGMLEQVAIQMAALQGQTLPTLERVQCVLFAGDHGVAAQGVSAFPQAVTVEMLKNFASGGAAMSVLARQQQLPLTLVNCGTASDCESLAGIVHRPVMAGTADFSQQAAMTEIQARQALQLGAEQAERLASEQAQLLIAGEMGIANTSAATVLSACLLQQPVAELVGPGTGLDDGRLAHKQQVLEQALQRTLTEQPTPTPLQALAQLGGLEIAAMAGAYVRAAQLGIPALVDGFIATSAALLAVQLNPAVRDWLLFSHGSAEPGHCQLLAALQAEPLLQLGMRLGEGSGAATALPLLRLALALHREMATFAEAEVSGP
jgi:nicotinate-nucleotide--dimethylbenzimidazole phosphoribosyltransferase